VDEVVMEERIQAAVLMTSLFESTALVRLDFSNSEEAKKEMYRQRQELRIKVKKSDPHTSPCISFAGWKFEMPSVMSHCLHHKNWM
jgi:hypothetical protein